MTSLRLAVNAPQNDTIIAYLNEIGREPLLSFEEEQDLAAKLQTGRDASERLANQVSHPHERFRLNALVHSGDEARGRLISCNLRLVVSIARRYQGHGLSLLDLIQEGTLGLMRAVDKFDPSRGLKFSTYATYWIRQSVGRAIADHGRTVRLPVHLGERLSRLARVRQQLLQRFDREPTVEELANEMELSIEQVLRAEKAALQPASLDEVHTDDGNGTLADTIADPLEPSPLDQVTHSLLRSDIEAVMGYLNGRERDIIRLRYGLEDDQPRTLEQIGKQLGLTRERVRQLEHEALRKLRDPALGQRLRGYVDLPIEE